MTYEHALGLLRVGHLHELTEYCKVSERWRNSDVDLRVLLIYALALAGETHRAEAALDIVPAKLSSIVRSQFEAALGIINWRSGDLESAWERLNSAVQFAVESKNVERIAWAHVHLLRFAVDAKPLDAFTVLLPRARHAVIRACIPSLTAYLHTCVATMEGNRGHHNEASRHCDIAESLLEVDSNAWILGVSFVNRGCIAGVSCEFKKAADYFRRAIVLADANGSVSTRATAEGNSGYLQMITGQFAKAEATLKRALSSTTKTDDIINPSDFLARVYLATGQLDKCEHTLDQLQLYSDSIHYSEYATRWTALTKAKLLLKRHEFAAAMKWLETVEIRSSALHDRPFSAAVHILSAQALHRMSEPVSCARRIIQADLAGIRETAELQGQFYQSTSCIVRQDNPGLAAQLNERAKRIWSNQGIVSIGFEIDDGVNAITNPKDSPGQNTASDQVKAVINCLGAAFDVADSPGLLGTELLRAIEISGCCSHAAIVEKSDGHEAFDRAGRRVILRLGDADCVSKALTLTCDAPKSPSDAIVLTDVFRIGRAAVALEKARQEERSRAALWPSDPLEEQAGALFVAEEMQSLLDTARRVAAANIPVLITGETGTGKEVLARLIHGYSPRAAKTFLPFNCSATPRDMLDAQLFGHRKGAFTGATENFSGVIRAAASGTLFLDEIGESTLDIQPKLLRFLESGEVHPIGETHPQRVDVRVLAATNADVDALVAQGRFREDLFYRLNIVRLHIPPLRERRVEIPAFANHYLQKYAKESAKGELRLSEETMEYLVLYRWPGNVRQIANEMRRLAALAEPGAVLMPEHLSLEIAASRRTVPATDRKPDPSEIVVRIDQPLSAALQHVERAMVQAALAKTNGVDEAAKLLGLSRKGLYLKRLRFGMEIDRSKSEIDVA